MDYQRKILALNLFVVLLCGGVVVFLSLYGVNQRAYLEPPLLKVLKEPKDNVSLWRENEVYGRILFHFDRKMHATYDPERLIPDNDNYMYIGILEDIVRTVYHVVPDRSWQEVSEHLARNPDATVYGPGFRISLEGTPLFILRARDVPHLEEKVLIHINADYWLEEDWSQVRDLLERGALRSDVVSLSGSVSDQQVQTLRDVLGIHDF